MQNIEEVEENPTMDDNDYVAGEEISPSPVIGARHNEIKNKHDNTCGCNDCFVEVCNSIKNLTKDNLTNIIRNFIKCRKGEATDLSTHERGCLCVEHLVYYKKKKLHVMNTILEKIKVDDTKSENKTRPL